MTKEDLSAKYPFMARMVIAGFFLYIVLGGVLNATFNWNTFNFYNICLLGNSAPLDISSTHILLFQFPVILMIVATIALDIISFVKMNERIDPLKQDQKPGISSEIMRTTFHVTITNSILIIPYVSYAVLMNAAFEGLTPQNLYLALVTSSSLINLFRNPIILILTSKYRKSKPTNSTISLRKSNVSIIILTPELKE